MKWWARLLKKDRLDAELQKELRFHLDRQIALLTLRKSPGFSVPQSAYPRSASRLNPGFRGKGIVIAFLLAVSLAAS